MYRLENIEYLMGLVLIPVLILLFILTKVWRKKALQKLGDIQIVSQLMPTSSPTKLTLRFVLFTVAILFLIFGIVNPQIGSKLEEVKREGSDIIICLDVSNSMKAEDYRPNRLEKAKQSIEKLIDKLNNDRIGIIVFAGEAYVQLPITIDYAAAKLFLEFVLSREGQKLMGTPGRHVARSDLANEQAAILKDLKIVPVNPALAEKLDEYAKQMRGIFGG